MNECHDQRMFFIADAIDFADMFFTGIDILRIVDDIFNRYNNALELLKLMIHLMLVVFIPDTIQKYAYYCYFLETLIKSFAVLIIVNFVHNLNFSNSNQTESFK
jgi:hypothetical protein